MDHHDGYHPDGNRPIRGDDRYHGRYDGRHYDDRDYDRYDGRHDGRGPSFQHHHHYLYPPLVPWIGYYPAYEPYFNSFGWFGLWCWDAPDMYITYANPSSFVRDFEVAPPPGFDDATVTYFKEGPDRTIRVELERDTPDGVEMLVLRDDHADGSLEQAVTVHGRDRDDAIMGYTARHENDFLIESPQPQALYQAFLYHDIIDHVRSMGGW